MINGIRNKIVTSIYSLNYINERGGGTYKGFDLLTQTIRNIIFEEYEYVIYTDYSSYEKFNLGKIFDRPNITIKFRELNSEYYLNFLNDLRLKRVSEGEIWDRIHSVENYIEVILNKLQFLIDESNNFDGNVIWIDSGLLGTSCSNAWRDYMNVVCHTKDFIDKIFSNIQDNNFICLKGNNIVINYELKQKLNTLIGKDLKIIPGALFGGKSEYVLNYFNDYKEVMNSIVSICGSYTSEQELLSILLDEKELKSFDFNDWDDLQRAFLLIMDSYNETLYMTNSMENYGEIVTKSLENNPNKYNSKFITKEDLKNSETLTFTQIADFFGIDRGSLHESHMYTTVYEEFLSNKKNQDIVMVEIGINDPRFPGGTIKFWDTIFPNMKYYGIDKSDCEHLQYNQDKIKTIQCDQKNEICLNEFILQNKLNDIIDIIIDDGTHESEDIITSFKTLFPFLKKGGIYFIEDLHAGWAKKDYTIRQIKDFLVSYKDIKVDFFKDKLLVIQK